jgi:hypothetical protein
MKALDIFYLLSQWGIWLRYGDGIPRYVSPHYALMRDNVEQHSSGPTAMISEDLCMLIDGIVARLRHKNAKMGDALIYRYSWEISYSAIGRKIDVSKPRAESLVKSAELWVEAIIDDRLTEAA